MHMHMHKRLVPKQRNSTRAVGVRTDSILERIHERPRPSRHGPRVKLPARTQVTAAGTQQPAYTRHHELHTTDTRHGYYHTH